MYHREGAEALLRGMSADDKTSELACTGNNFIPLISGMIQFSFRSFRISAKTFTISSSETV